VSNAGNIRPAQVIEVPDIVGSLSADDLWGSNLPLPNRLGVPALWHLCLAYCRVHLVAIKAPRKPGQSLRWRPDLTMPPAGHADGMASGRVDGERPKSRRIRRRVGDGVQLVPGQLQLDVIAG
jgi:hypothetical protein